MTPPRILLALAAALLSSAGLSAQEAAAPAAQPADPFLATLTRDLSAHFNLDGELQLELIRPWAPAKPLAPGWSLSVVGYPPNPASTMIVRCQYRDAAGAAEEPTLIVHASLWRDAWVVRMPIKAGDDFDSSRLDTQRSDVLRDRDLVPADIQGRDYIFARSVEVGRMLTWHDVGRHPLVRKGEVVVVTASEGELIVSVKALALESGAQGDTISVRNTESQKVFSALVTDENHVQVQF